MSINTTNQQNGLEPSVSKINNKIPINNRDLSIQIIINALLAFNVMVAVDDELKLLKEQVNRNIGLNLESIVFLLLPN